MLEYLLEELEISKEKYAELKRDSVELAYIDEVYRQLINQVKLYDTTYDQLITDGKEAIFAVLATLVSYYFTAERPETMLYFLSIAVTLLSIACVYDLKNSYITNRDVRKSIENYGCTEFVSCDILRDERSKIHEELRNKNSILHDAEEYMNAIKRLIVTPDILDEIKKYPGILKDYLEKEFASFIEERVSPDKVNLLAPSTIESDAIVYKRI